MKFNWFENASPGAKIVLSFAVIASSMLILSFVMILAALPFFGKSIYDVLTVASNFNNPENLAIIKYLQVTQSIAIFVVPPFLLAIFFGFKPMEYLQLKKAPISNLVLMTILLLIAFLPFVSLTESMNSHLKLPESLKGLEQWMRATEDNAEALTKVFLNVKTIGALIFNIVMMALIPAIGEELVFRGIFQKLFTELFKNFHWGIIISAAVFSAIHMQFYGFIPRMLLGMMFGYMLVWTGNLWIPIIAHFANNAIGVIYYYMTYNGKIDDRLEPYASNVSTATALFSLIITAGLLYVFYNRTRLVEKS